MVRKLIPKRWHIHLALVAIVLFVGFPLIYALLVSTQSDSDVYAYRMSFGNEFMTNWDLVMNRRSLGDAMWNSAVMAVSIAAGKTIIALFAGLAFVYFRFPGKWIVFGFVLITLMMPTEVIFIALLRFVSSLKLPTYLNLVLPFLASATGTFLFRQHFASIPPELSEAAQLDGAGPLSFLIRILVPMSWNTIGALVVIQFLYGWNMYLWPRMITSAEEAQVVQIRLRIFLDTEANFNYGPLMLAAVLASIPPVLIFVFLQKQFMSGFSLSRDK